MSYVYIKSEPGLWTVGFYDPKGKWQSDSDHSEREHAAARVAYLNGASDNKRLRDALQELVNRCDRTELADGSSLCTLGAHAALGDFRKDQIDTAVEFYMFDGGLEFYECGCCGQCHPVAWSGDCREDAARFTLAQLEAKHGKVIATGEYEP